MSISIREKLFRIVLEETGVDPAGMDPDADFRANSDLDSMQLVGVVARIEQDFDIEIPMEVMEVSSINGFVTLIEEQMGKREA